MKNLTLNGKINLKIRKNIVYGGIKMAKNGGGLSFWGMVGAVLVALIIFSFL
ncbi:MAG: hypothetical protein HUJ77_08385 [Clostridium sp.]|nr:hypothetical protein [Clostridium sp.]